MKIRIDFTEKIITVENAVNLKEFYDKLKLILPDGKWKEYTLETNVIINNWNNPVIIEKYPWYDPYPYPNYEPYISPWIITYDTNGTGGHQNFVSTTSTGEMDFEIE